MGEYIFIPRERWNRISRPKHIHIW